MSYRQVLALRWAPLILALSVGLLAGCKDEKEPKPLTFVEPLPTEEEAALAAIPLRREVYPDPEIYDKPRYQFWSKQLDKGSYTRLWSMRLDGSDRRLVADEELLFNGATLNHLSVRSPDNRYVAVSMNNSEGFFRGLIDLKTQTSWVIVKGGGVPHFIWTPDSENLIFYSDGEHYNYNITTKTLSKRPIIYSQGLFLLPGGAEFLAVKHNGFWIHKFNGEVIRKVEFKLDDFWNIKYPNISPNGEELCFTMDGGPQIKTVRASIPKGEIISIKPEKDALKKMGFCKYSPDSRAFMFPHYMDLYRIDFDTGKVIKIPLKEDGIWGMGGYGRVTLYNLH